MNEVKHNHVQLSKFLMKPYSHKTNEGYKVFYLDVNSGEILEEKINKLGTMPEYYYPETEKYLNKEVESKVGDVFAALKEAAKNESSFQLTGVDCENIKRLFAYAFLRSDGVKQETVKKSVHLQFIPPKMQTDLIIRTPQHALELFREYFVNLLVNKSNVGFVLPHNCMYSVSFQHKTTWFWCMPISPVCSVLLIPNEYRDRYKKGDIITPLIISDTKMAEDFNESALASENTYSRKFIIGEKTEIKRLSTKIIKYGI